ncbi:MAG: LysR family transcriptional regulator, partial [Rhodospirillales bacterium]
MLPMTLKQLEIFVAVAEQNGFRRASERLNLSQSAVTAHIKLLEAHLGVPLFHRTTRTIRMTEAGENLYRRAGRILEGLEDIVR